MRYRRFVVGVSPSNGGKRRAARRPPPLVRLCVRYGVGSTIRAPQMSELPNVWGQVAIDG
jgi:hypothetical protein